MKDKELNDLDFFTRNAQQDKRARKIQDQIIAERKIQMNKISIEILHGIIKEAQKRAERENG
jgi:hypothetical protein